MSVSSKLDVDNGWRYVVLINRFILNEIDAWGVYLIFFWDAIFASNSSKKVKEQLYNLRRSSIIKACPFTKICNVTFRLLVKIYINDSKNILEIIACDSNVFFYPPPLVLGSSSAMQLQFCNLFVNL